MLRVIRTTDSGIVTEYPYIRFYKNAKGNMAQDVVVKFEDDTGAMPVEYYTSLGEISFEDAVKLLGFKDGFVPELEERELSPFKATWYSTEGKNYELVFPKGKKAHFKIEPTGGNSDIVIALASVRCVQAELCPAAAKRNPSNHGRFGIVRLKRGEYARFDGHWYMPPSDVNKCDGPESEAVERLNRLYGGKLTDCTGQLNKSTIVSTTVTLF